MLANPGRLKLRALMALMLVAGVLTPTAVQAQSPKATPTERAQKMLEREVTMITKLMHPTATYKSSEHTINPLPGDKFQIASKYHFKNFFGQEFYSGLHFHFNAKGGLEEIKLGERDGVFAPFMAADLASNVTEIIRNNKEVTTLLRRGQVRAGLLLWLNGSF